MLPTMLRHVVNLRWRDDIPAGQVAAITTSLLGLVPEIDSIRSFTCGPDLGLRDERWDFAVVADFDDVEGWTIYHDHPTHDRIRTEMIYPWVSDRSIVQFEL